MTAGITVDLRAATPPYEQIRSQISSLIVVGVLEPGIRLPSVRGLATDLGIAAGTVARAYRELEADGLVESRRRHGTVVAAGDPARKAPSGMVPVEVSAAVDRYIEAGRRAQLGDDVLLHLLKSRLGPSRLEP